jgi:cystathionine gamma-synthase
MHQRTMIVPKNQKEQILESRHPATMAAQALGWVDEQTKALIPPVHPATTFVRDPDNQYRSGYSYGRPTNPTFVQPEALLARLEGGAACLTFASGMAAATAVFLALKPGDHVVAPHVMYWGLRNWLKSSAEERKLVVDFVDAGATDALAAAVKPGRTKLIWIESPANPIWAITDIAAAAAAPSRRRC